MWELGARVDAGLPGKRGEQTRIPRCVLDLAGVCGAPGEAVSHFPPSSDALRDGKEVKWPDAMYPDLHMPFAPSWSLHWAYRDGHLVNLPVSLLVEGDIIALRPGQESFASLRGIKVAGGSSPSLEILWERPPAVMGGSWGLILTLAAQLAGFLASALGKNGENLEHLSLRHVLPSL